MNKLFDTPVWVTFKNHYLEDIFSHLLKRQFSVAERYRIAELLIKHNGFLLDIS